jgi:uncharacterized protein YndB with AHSA1/START domain
MVKNEHEVVINRPPEQVFGFISDLDNWRQWRPGMQDVEKLTPGPIAAGTVWRLTGDVQGQSIVVTVEVTEYESNRQFGFKTTSGPNQAQDTFTLTPVAGSTKLNFALELADPALARPAREQWEKDMLILKELLEVQA